MDNNPPKEIGRIYKWKVYQCDSRGRVKKEKKLKTTYHRGKSRLYYALQNAASAGTAASAPALQFRCRNR